MDTIRLEPDFDRYDELLALILAAFACMDGRIDPPSSARALTVEALRQKVSDEIAFAAVRGGELLGCVFLKPEPECLYVGKLAVAPASQRRGIGRHLIDIAEQTARNLSLPALRLQTRIELAENHAIFGAWGFVEAGRSAHPGFTRPTSIEMKKVIVL